MSSDVSPGDLGFMVPLGANFIADDGAYFTAKDLTVVSISPEIPYLGLRNTGTANSLYIGVICDGTITKGGCMIEDAPARLHPESINGTYKVVIGSKDGRYREEYTLIFDF